MVVDHTSRDRRSSEREHRRLNGQVDTTLNRSLQEMEVSGEYRVRELIHLICKRMPDATALFA